MSHLGILAHSTEGAALCFLAFCQEGYRQRGRNEHPDVTLDYIAFGYSMAAWDAADYAAVRAILAVSAQRLADAGADFFACPDNTAHLALEHPGPNLALPGLHIAAEVAGQAAREGRRRVGILGTRFLASSPLYPRALAARGITAEMPSAADRRMVDEIIFAELVNGVCTGSSRAACAAVIGRLAARGCDAVALACTELPVLISPADSPLPTLDSARLLARAAYQVADGQRRPPGWRGGPVPAG